MAGNAVIGSLRVNLGLDSAAFTSGLKGSQKDIDAFAKKIAVGAAAVTAAATAMATALAVSIKRTIDQADELGKSAQKFGVAVDELSRLKHAADLSGVSIEGLGTGLRKLSQNMQETAKGAKNAASEAFAALGIAVSNSDGTLRSSSDVMIDVADRLGLMRDGAQKTAVAMAIFGRSGADLIPMLNSGANGLRQMMQEADNLGIVIDTNTAKAAENFNDNLTRLEQAKNGVITKITAHLLPALELLSEKFIKVANDGDKIKEMAEGAVAALGWIANEVAQVAILASRLSVEFASLGETISRALSLDFSGAWAAFQEGQAQSAKMAADLKTQIESITSGSAISQAGIQRRMDEAFGTAGVSAGEQFVAKFAEGASNTKALEAAAERMKAALKSFQMSLMNESELERAQYAERLAELQTFLDSKLISQAEYQTMAEQLREQHNQRMAELAKAQADEEANQRARVAYAYADAIGSVGRLLEAFGDKNLAASKAFAIAEAIVNTAVGITMALRQQGPLGFASAAAIAAAGAAQIATIAKTNRGAKAAPSVSGSAGAAANNNSPSAGNQQAVSIQLHGDVYSRQSVEELLEQINAATADGHKLVIRSS